MRRIAAATFIFAVPFILLAESEARQDCAGCGVGKPTLRGPNVAYVTVKSCEASPPDIASACVGLRLLAPADAELSGYELLSDLVLYWPKLLGGLASFTVDKALDDAPKILLPVESEPARPHLLATYVRIRRAAKAPGAAAAVVTEEVLDCVPIEASAVLEVKALAQTQDYFQFRAFDLADKAGCHWSKEEPGATGAASRPGKKKGDDDDDDSYRNAVRFSIDGTAALADGVADDVYFEAYAAVHGEIVGWRQKIETPARFLARGDGNRQGTEIHAAAAGAKSGVREVFALDPRTGATPAAISPEHPLILVAALTAPLDKITDFAKFFRLRAAGQEAALATAAYAQSYAGRFFLASASDVHDETELVIDLTLPMRGAVIAADAPAPTVSSEKVKVVVTTLGQ